MNYELVKLSGFGTMVATLTPQTWATLVTVVMGFSIFMVLISECIPKQNKEPYVQN